MSDRRRLTLTRRRALGLTAGLGLGSLAPSIAFGASASASPVRPRLSRRTPRVGAERGGSRAAWRRRAAPVRIRRDREDRQAITTPRR